MDYDLEGRVALVTGAASGIGRATDGLLAGTASDAASFVTGEALTIEGGLLAR